MQPFQDPAFIAEIRSDFVDLIERLADQIDEQIDWLREPSTYQSAIDTLFRAVHSTKPIASYLGFEAVFQFFIQFETVLQILRSRERILDRTELIAWLDRIADQIQLWRDELRAGQPALSTPDPDINRLQIRARLDHPRQVLAPLSLLIVSPVSRIVRSIESEIAPLFARTESTSTFDTAVAALEASSYEIIICDHQLDPGHSGMELYRHVSRQNDDFPPPFLMITGALNRQDLQELIRHGIAATPRPLDLDRLRYELIDMGQLYYGEKEIRIFAPQIRERIEMLKPLPESVRKIIDLCSVEESAVKDVAFAVKNDPVVTALVLKQANASVFNNRHYRSVDRAVAFLGKQVVKAVTLSLASEQFEPVNLTCYNMTPERFKETSNLRLALMLAWYAKVDIRKLDILASVAIISNLGQVILAREITARNACGVFETLLEEYPVSEAEMILLGTTTSDVTAEILKSWRFDRLTVDVIRYSCLPDFAPEEAREMAWANHIVCRLIPPNMSTLPATLPEELREKVQTAGLEPEPLEQALKRFAEA